jgi:hypothetical protein
MPGYGRNNVLRVSAKGSVANKAVTLEVGKPGQNMRMFVQAVFLGYGGTGTLEGGLLTYEDGVILPGESSEVNKVELPIASKGTQELALAYQTGPEKDAKFTLAAGGENVTGYLTVVYYID